MLEKGMETALGRLYLLHDIEVSYVFSQGNIFTHFALIDLCFYAFWTAVKWDNTSEE